MKDVIMGLDATYENDQWTSKVDNGTSTLGSITYNCYDYWHTHYYPTHHYPVVYNSHTEDRATKAFKLAKALMAKKLIRIDKVKDFVALMDEIIEII